MKRGFVLLLLIAGTFVTGVVSGQPTRPIPDQGEFVDRPAWSNPDGAFGSRSLVGAPVRDAAGRVIGKIDELMIDPRAGSISHAVIAIGPLPGLTGRKIVVPWSDVEFSTAAEHVRKAPPRERTIARLNDDALARALRYEPDQAEATPSASPDSPSRGRK